MQRLANLTRSQRALFRSGNGPVGTHAPAQARLANLGGVRYKIDSTTIGNDPDAALQKSHDDAKVDADKREPFSEGHSLDRKKDSFQDPHTEQLSKAQDHSESGAAQSGSDTDAINLSKGADTGEAEAQRKAHATPASGYQPGQKGDQVGGGGTVSDGAQTNEGKAGTEKASNSGTFSGLGQAAKNVFGGGPSNGFHTYARLRASAVPESAVDKGARKPKDKNVEGAQNEHLPHHGEGQGDKMPAVKNSASLPSKQGDASQKKSNSTKTGTNQGKGPSHELRPTGTANTPGSRAVDPASATHSPSFAPTTGPSATYKHVIGTPEPDSHQTAYAYSTKSESGHLPSGTDSRSSTSTSPYPKHTTEGILKDEAGIGSSNSKVEESLKGADELVSKQEVGQAGDDVGGRQSGGRAYAVPPDVGEIEEDTLPRPIKQ